MEGSNERRAICSSKEQDLGTCSSSRRKESCGLQVGLHSEAKHLKEKVDRYKARLVAKVYSQTYGIDYDETFAPVTKMGRVRTLISCAANFGWPLHQLDVKNTFLHGDLQEEAYMEIPSGFGNEQTLGKVCKLRKAL